MLKQLEETCALCTLLVPLWILWIKLCPLFDGRLCLVQWLNALILWKGASATVRPEWNTEILSPNTFLSAITQKCHALKLSHTELFNLMFPKGIFISPMLTYVCIHFTIGITEETKFMFLIHIQQEKKDAGFGGWKEVLLSQNLLNDLWGKLPITSFAYRAVQKYSFQLQIVWLFWYLIQSRVLWKVIKKQCSSEQKPELSNTEWPPWHWCVCTHLAARYPTGTATEGWWKTK